MTEQETYAEKIAKLLRKAESTTPEEAELLMAKAQELMAKYSIDQAMINAARGAAGKSADPILHDEFVTVGIYRHALYMIDFYCLLCYGCKPIEIPGSPWKTIDGRTYKETRVLKAVGYQSDIETARMLATSLKLQCMTAETAWWKENGHLYSDLTKSKQHASRRGFMLAFGSAAFTRLKLATEKARTAANAQHGENSVALVLRDKSLAVEDEFSRLYPRTQKSKSRLDQGSVFARNAGHDAGSRADIGGTKFGGSKKEINR